MDNTPNPYRPPEAPVDPHLDAGAAHSVRILLRVLLVVQIALIPLALMVPDTLPSELQRMRDDSETAFINSHGAVAMLAIALLVASLLGLWWEKRWAAWTYVAANVVGYGVQLAAGPRIASDLTGLVDSFADAAVGATLIALYLGGYLSQRPPDAQQ